MAASRFKVSTGLNVTTVNTALHVVAGTQASGGKILCLDSSGDVIFKTNTLLKDDLGAGDVSSVAGDKGLTGTNVSGAITIDLN